VKQWLEDSIKHHPVRFAAGMCGVVGVSMVPVLLFMVSAERRVAMTFVAAATLLVSFVIVAVGLRSISRRIP